MPSESYTYLAQFYSHLMKAIDYQNWADYIIELTEEFKIRNPKVLELSCGTGNIARILQNSFNKFYLSDLSMPMLDQIPDINLPKICCDMTMLPFKQEFNFIFSTFDSVNYLMSKDQFLKFLSEVSKVLKRNGVLTFDVSLENNSLRYQKYLNRSGKVKGIKYKQKSYFNVRSRIHYNHFEITLADGKKVEEIHKQKIYRFEDYFEFIEDSDFYVSKCYETFTFQNANAATERAQFILKKRN